VVRGPAPLLGASLGALALFLLAPALPDLGDGDVAILVPGTLGLLALAGIALGLLPAREATWLLVLVGLGAALIAAALDAAGAATAANVPKAIFAAAGGMLLAWGLAAPVVVVAVPIFVSAIDVWSVSTGPTSKLLESGGGAIDYLTFEIPAWGGGTVGQLGISDIVFLAFFAALACRYDLRPRLTCACLALALPVALVAQLEIGGAVPVLPFLAAALLLPGIDRLPRLLRGPEQA
jgi:hypothetical protein